MTMNLLAIETSQGICSVGLLLDGTRIVLSEHVEKKHNERLLPMLTELRDSAGLTQQGLMECLDFVAFGRGPGSFTGVRIAASAAQAIALAAGASMLRVSSSEAMAEQVLKTLAVDGGVVTAIRSRRDLYYLAAYQAIDGAPVRSHVDTLYDVEPDDGFVSRYGQWTLTGETPGWWQGSPAVEAAVDAHAILDVAERMLLAGEAVDPALGLPDYFSGDSPWRKSS